MIEKEMKYTIDLYVFEKLYLYYNKPIVTKQINYYFDTLDFYFLNNGITLRVRKKNGKHAFKIKRKIYSPEEITKAEEIEVPLSQSQFDRIIYQNLYPEEVKQILNKNNWNRRIHYLGTMNTERAIVHQHNCDICLDKNRYLNRVDYEIEIEGDEKDIQFITQKLENMLVKADLHIGEGKYKRFCKELLVEGGGYLIRNQVSCIPIYENKYCLIKKNKPNSSVYNMWIPAGGHIEYQEAIQDACIREIREETGILISNLRLTGIVTFRDGTDYHSICNFYVAEASSDKIIITESNIEAKWFTLDEIKQLENITDYHREIYMQMLVYKKNFVYDLIKTDSQYVEKESAFF